MKNMSKSEIERKIKKFVERCLDVILSHSKPFQDYINYRYNRARYTAIETRYLDDSYCTHNGVKFYLNDAISTLTAVETDYCFDDIHPSDIVLDIGANIGAFALQAAKKANHVYAVEPLYADYLRKNIELNNINNITVLEFGLGDELKKQHVEFRSRRDIIITRSLSSILELIGGCDFLKVDCEGGEWHIKPDELDGMRRIECEVHNLDGKHNLDNFRHILIDAGFEYISEKRGDRIMLFHAKKV